MDRLPLVQALTAAGLQRDGAEHVATALGEAIEATVATKSDVAALRSELKADGAALKADLAALRNEFKADLAALRNEFKADLAALRSEMKDALHSLEMRLTFRLGALMVTCFGLMFAALRLSGRAP